MKQLVLLALLVIVFDIFVFFITSDLGLPGMKRLTPMLASIYFLWVLAWRWVEQGGIRGVRGVWGIWGVRVILGLLLLHHLIVYPVNVAAVKEPSPFKVTDWFDENNPQKSVEEYAALAQKEDLKLDCRPIVAQLGQCSYDFIYPAVMGSCKWNNMNCHQILGYDGRTGQFIPLSIDLWQRKYWDQ